MNSQSAVEALLNLVGTELSHIVEQSEADTVMEHLKPQLLPQFSTILQNLTATTVVPAATAAGTVVTTNASSSRAKGPPHKNGYNVFTAEYCAKLKAEDPSVKNCGERARAAWNDLTPAEKKVYSGRATEINSAAKAKYLEEHNGVMPTVQRSTRRASGYSLFSSSLKGSVPPGVLFPTFASQQWNDLGPEGKEVWNKKAIEANKGN